jgi:hypothetical protein
VKGLVVDVCSLFDFLKVALNFSTNASKLFKNDIPTNHIKVMLDNNLPMSLTWAKLFG